MTVDQRTFRKALGCFATGVTVVTSINPDDNTPAGVTVSAFSSVSLEPPLVLFCLGNKTSSLNAFKQSGRFVINVLAENQRDLSIRFASRSDDKWAGVSMEVGLGGVPVLSGCIANLECSIVNTVESGDHVIFIGEVEGIHYQEGGAPLLYFRGAYMDCCTGSV
ncbi:flavin reductase family protein [Magnetospirillum sulfuroxidans]|uniref:Flavin reductase family protein n=1 Tax=Magnetospirillum sulfuroxidans TaxID=611300 RepID=A0ABS5I7W0_9PROT|nr:flavin reductase family protein [Magnetospirillum sulfuroxidans]MBR9970526.1 flavin reductase family protein [Magnetospirillum sulfuroxidans]